MKTSFRNPHFACVLLLIGMFTTSGLLAAPNYDNYPKYKITLDNPSYRVSFLDENGTSWSYRNIDDKYSKYRIIGVTDVRTSDYILKHYRYDTAVSGTIPENLIVPSKISQGSVTIISPLAFADLDIKSITIPESVTSIEDSAFSNCPNLKEVILPKNVSVGPYAFQYCISLTAIPENLKAISSGMFANCLGFTAIEIPETITFIGSYAFASCENLKSITIPQSVTSIGSYAFNTCHNLKSITIPQSVTSIGEGAFNSLNFDEVCVSSSPQGWDTNVFGTSPGCIKLFKCPSEHLNAWLSYFAAVSITPLKIETELATIKAVTTLDNGGTLSFRNKQLVKGEAASITATPNEGYIFLGWSSDVEEIGGSEPTLTFTVPERNEVLLIANFFPKTLLTTLVNETLNATLDAKVESTVNAKIDGEKLLTAEQSAAKTTATIKTKVAAGELITSEQLQEMALSEPVIEVKEGAATVGISVMKASSVDGEWEAIALESDATKVESDKIQVTVPADGKAAFYKFVVPEK